VDIDALRDKLISHRRELLAAKEAMLAGDSLALVFEAHGVEAVRAIRWSAVATSEKAKSLRLRPPWEMPALEVVLALINETLQAI
jgi:hypothetical protein